MPQFAGFWRRAAANLIDSIIICIVLMLPFYLYYGGIHQMNLHPIYHLFTMPCCIAYYVFFLSSHYQATPGKWLMRVYVVAAQDYKRLTTAHALGRYFAYSGPALLIMFVPFFFTPPEIYHPSVEDKQRAAAIYYDYQHIKPVSAEERKFFNEYQEKQKANKAAMAAPFFVWCMLLGLVSLGYMIALATTVAFTGEKTGIHDMICKTRALVGRPETQPAANPSSCEM